MSKAFFLKGLISSAALLPLLAGAAAANVPLTTPDVVEKSYSASLQAVARDRAVRTLDWRTPAVELRFDLSQADIISDLSVTLSADPLRGANPDTPILVQFNNGRPVPIETRGEGFDATVPLNAARARSNANVLRLSYGTDCLTAEGGYAVNLDESRIDIAARPKRRRLQLREVESRLGNSAFTPQSVGLIAKGPLATTVQALGAQAIGLRMDALPDFRTDLNGTDFNLVMVPRSALFAYTDEADILSGSGAAIALSRNHPNRLFLTGDTDTEVRQAIEAFAKFYLPQSRRSITTPGEMSVQNPLGVDRMRIDGTARLDRLSVQTGALREYVFDVSDPAATQGDLVLRLTRDDQTAPGARMKAVLNGVSLGEAKLDTRRKTVAYPIRPGLLNGTENRLELTTKAGTTAKDCSIGDPFISLGAGSKLRLSAGAPSAASDLSLLAASGSVFAYQSGAQTQIVLPDGDADFGAALSVIARLAKASGSSWTDAQFVRGTSGTTDRHVLVIEPFQQIEDGLRGAAPRGLKSAWNGQPAKGDNRLASVERFASLDAEEAVRLAARRARADGTIESGGVAALYPAGDGRLVGVISNTPGVSFRNALEPLSGDAHWNGLTGGVTRWNDRAVVMAQTALPTPQLRKPVAPTPSDNGILDRLANVDLSGVRRYLVDPADLGEWLQDKWDAFSIKAQRESGTLPPEAPPMATEPLPMPNPDQPVRVAELDAPLNDTPVIAMPRLKPAPMAATETSDAEDALDLQQSVRTAQPRATGIPKLRNGLSQMDANTQGLRAELRRKIGIQRPKLKSIRIGTLEIVPAALIMILTVIFVLIGLAFMSPNRVSGGT